MGGGVGRSIVRGGARGSLRQDAEAGIQPTRMDGKAPGAAGKVLRRADSCEGFVPSPPELGDCVRLETITLVRPIDPLAGRDTREASCRIDLLQPVIVQACRHFVFEHGTNTARGMETPGRHVGSVRLPAEELNVRAVGSVAIQGHLNSQVGVPWEHEILGQANLIHQTRLRAEDLAGRCHDGVQIGSQRKHDLVVKPVLEQVGLPARAQGGLPAVELGGRGQVQLAAEPRVSHLSVTAPPRRCAAVRFHLRMGFGLDPAPLALPRIVGQRNPLPPAGIEATPIDVESARVKRAERTQHRLQVAVVVPERWEHHGVVATVLEALHHGGGQHGMRAQLDEGAIALLTEPFDRRGEPDGLADVVAPVFRIQLPAVVSLARDRGIERNLRSLWAQSREGGLETGPRRFELRSVACTRHVHHAPADFLLAKRLDDFLQSGPVAGNHRVLRAVVDRNPQAVLVPADELLGPFGGNPQGGHAAASGQSVQRVLKQPAAVEHHADSLGQVQDPGRVRGSHLSHAVAHDGIGSDLPGFPGFRQCHLEGEKTDLRDLNATAGAA